MQRDILEKYAQSSIVTTDNQESQETEQDSQTPMDEIQDIYVLIVREREEAGETIYTVESTPVILQKTSLVPAYPICGLYLFCLLATLVFQLSCIFNPPIATVTIIPKTQRLTLSSTVQLGRLLPPLTISQSQTVPTTGRGHQDARTAVGTVTFYNGQQTSQTIAQGTVFTGQSGVSIQTTQQATIPPGNPGTGYGTTNVTAQALQAGSRSNIHAGDVNTPIALAVFVKNNQFSGGQNERDFQTVATRDITAIATPLKAAVSRSMHGAFQGQAYPSEQLQLLPCQPTVTSDRPLGAEARQVTITVSQTCSAVAYDRSELAQKATDFLTRHSALKAGTGYSLLATSVSLTQASITHTATPLVFLTFQVMGTWVYALGNAEQLHIQRLIAGKSTPDALRLVASLPGVENAAIHFTGFGDPERVPKNTQSIHFVLLIV